MDALTPKLFLPHALPESPLPRLVNATYAALGDPLQQLTIPEEAWRRGCVVNGHFVQRAGGEVRIGRVDASRLSDGTLRRGQAGEFVFLREELLQLGRQVGMALEEVVAITLIAVLEAWPWPERVVGLKAAREELLTYLKNHARRMDYPAYEANDWYIGSGALESACQTVVGQRLKGAGMRWSERGAHEICHVRALYLSEHSQWLAFWQRDIRP